jgi:uncharacterized membrane protein
LEFNFAEKAISASLVESGHVSLLSAFFANLENFTVKIIVTTVAPIVAVVATNVVSEAIVPVHVLLLE